LIFVGLVACYEPQLPLGAPCRDSARCPDGQQCIAGACSLADLAPVDASPGSGHERVPPDATSDAAIDAAGDSCQGSATCATAVALGTLSGDTDHQTLSSHGSRGAWLRVRVTENDGSPAGIPLSLRATLTVSGGDFDVVLHVNPDRDVVECTASLGTASSNGNAKQILASWGEEVVANGDDDSRDVSIEIRPVAGACAAGAQWQLLLEGNA